MATLGNPKQTIEVLQKYQFHFQKKYGQNFLIDAGVLERIVAVAGITKDDYVLEIGPGIGSMTQYLCEAARGVTAVEIDRNLIPILAETLKEYDNVEILNQDILKVDIAALAREKNDRGLVGSSSTEQVAGSGSMEKNAGNGSTEKVVNGELADKIANGEFTEKEVTGETVRPIKVVANLPYYITTPIIMELFESHAPIESITVMVQKEVAERMKEGPGSKEYGALSLAVQYYAKPEIMLTVPPSCFMPQPQVESTVIRLQRYDKPPVEVQDEKLMFRIIRASFNQRRKTLANGLMGGGGIPLSKEQLESCIESLGVPANIRGEMLSLAQFAELSNRIGSLVAESVT